MTVAVPIYQGQDFYVPAFQVKRLGQQQWLPAKIVHDITGVTYTDELEQIDSFTLTVNNWDADKLRFKYSDGAEFLPGVELELCMGYLGQDPLRRMITGSITSAQPSFPASGQPILTVTGQNRLQKLLQRDKRSVAYENMTDSQIARMIGARLDITVRTDPDAEAGEERYRYLLQKDRPSILFLLERARRIGYDLDVGEDEERFLFFGPSVDVRRVTYQLTYGRSLTEFEPNLDTTDQVGELTLRSWDNVNKELIEHTARRSDLQTRGVGDAGGQQQIERSFSHTKETITCWPVQTPQEAQIVATETLERNAKDMLTARGATVGLPDLRAGTVIHVDGVGMRYSGRYFVTSTTHTIGDGGYTTRFACRREEL